jgi:hypothetical protein
MLLVYTGIPNKITDTLLSGIRDSVELFISAKIDKNQ